VAEGESILGTVDCIGRREGLGRSGWSGFLNERQGLRGDDGVLAERLWLLKEGMFVSTLGRLWTLWGHSGSVGVKGDTGGGSVGDGSEGHTARAVSVEIQGLEGGCRGAFERWWGGEGGSTRMSSLEGEEVSLGTREA
jgi:hypothetical protein